ncbi:MAG: hypothetical protein DKT66_23675 [Candidatus Melainabacteria bacterium]|nr:MAG: hypothetical protein DKT66_23675 [Candidatus Melainabacteria bacterium]
MILQFNKSSGKLSRPAKTQKVLAALCASSICASLLSVSISAPSVSAQEERSSGTTRGGNDIAPGTVLKGSATYTVPKGTPFKLKLTQVPTNGLRLLDRDLDGNLLPAQLNDEICAKVSEDIYIDDHKVIPEGTVFHGKVSRIHDPRRFYRKGWLEVSFDSLKTPDGRRFAFKVDADNFKTSTAKSKLKGTGRILSHAAGGAIVGTLVAYQLTGGMKGTAESKGMNLAIGAAAGALIAGGYAAYEKGPRAVLEPGDDLNMAIDSDLLMPAAVEPKVRPKAYSLEGLDVTIKKIKTKKDNLAGGCYFKILEVSIDNNTDHSLNAIDCYLLDSEGNKHPLTAGLDEDSEFIFHVEPNSISQHKMSFRVDFPHLKYTLVWLDHNSRRVCYKQPLPL